MNLAIFQNILKPKGLATFRLPGCLAVMACIGCMYSSNELCFHHTVNKLCENVTLKFPFVITGCRSDGGSGAMLVVLIVDIGKMRAMSGERW